MLDAKEEEGQCDSDLLFFKEIEEGFDRTLALVSMLHLCGVQDSLWHSATLDQFTDTYLLLVLVGVSALVSALFNLPASACENVAVMCPVSK